MLKRGTKVAVDRDDLIALIDDYLELRSLLLRLGGDLREIVLRSRPA
jgi:hypothetical protein